MTVRSTALALASLAVFSACATTLAPKDGEIVGRVGPVDLPAQSGDAHSHEGMPEKAARWRVAESGWITSFHPAMQDEGGKPMPGKLLHHVAIAERSRGDYLCTEHSHKMPHLILASGSELTEMDLPEGYGIPVRKGAKVFAGGMFGFAEGEPAKGAYLVARMGFVPERSGTKLKPIVPVWLDVLAACPEEGYPITGKRDVKTREFSFPFSGQLHLAGGHMHDGGRLLVLTRLSDGTEVVRFEPSYEDESIAAIPIAQFSPNVRVETSERYRLEAVYENVAHHAGNGMGIVVAYVEPDRLEDAL